MVEYKKRFDLPPLRDGVQLRKSIVGAVQ